MSKTEVQKSASGFAVKQSTEYARRMEREARIKAAKNNKNPTVNDTFKLMLDIADRQSEIFDMLKTK